MIISVVNETGRGSPPPKPHSVGLFSSSFPSILTFASSHVSISSANPVVFGHSFRNRIYIVAFKKPDDCRSFRNIYGDGLEKRDMDERFAQIVTDGPVPLKYYYSKDDPNKCISIRYEEHFVPAVTEHGVFYQYRRTKMRRNQNGLCPALTASMGGGGHNVPIILDDYGIRKLTPRECLNVQGFPKWYEFPEDMADGHKYKQAGNSVSVPVIHSFADIIHHALEDADKSKQ